MKKVIYQWALQFYSSNRVVKVIKLRLMWTRYVTGIATIDFYEILIWKGKKMATCIKYDEDSIHMDVRKPIYEDMINCLLPVP